MQCIRLDFHRLQNVLIEVAFFMFFVFFVVVLCVFIHDNFAVAKAQKYRSYIAHALQFNDDSCLLQSFLYFLLTMAISQSIYMCVCVSIKSIWSTFTILSRTSTVTEWIFLFFCVLNRLNSK